VDVEYYAPTSRTTLNLGVFVFTSIHLSPRSTLLHTMNYSHLFFESQSVPLTIPMSNPNNITLVGFGNPGLEILSWQG
jgi:hypothetical protein